jgi:predicted ATPase
LSYGEGISYGPIVEVLKQLDVSRPASALDPSVAQPLSVLLGQEGSSSPDEIAWAFRKRIEVAALEGPLVVVFDDIHWGAGVFLDLLEHLVFLSVGAPIFMLCMARQELLERDAGWPDVVRLEPLRNEEAAELLRARSRQT